MTTLIVVAIVGLVFFVTICVAGFMVWKRETEIRTDSIGAIERSIGEVVNELSGINSEINADTAPPGKLQHQSISAGNTYEHAYPVYEEQYDQYDRNYRAYGHTTRGSESRRTNNSRKEPYEWVRSDVRSPGNVSIFRPEKSASRRLRWTEVSDTASDGQYRQTARPASRGPSRFRRRKDATDTLPNTEPVYEQDFEENELDFMQEFEAEPEYAAESENPVSPDTTDGQLQSDEINLATINLDDLDSISLDEFEFFDDAEDRSQAGDDYSTGRSGKKYTAQELESLIKE